MRARCREAITAPSSSALAEKTSPRCKPPALSEIHPTTVGPAICPKANTVVNPLMPADHACGGRLWRTSAVVEATTDRNTAPKSMREANTAKSALLRMGTSVATAS